MRKLFLSLLFTSFFIPVHGVDNLRSPDIRSLGMGGNVVTQSVLFNPALINHRDSKSIHLEYFNRFKLKEASTISGSFYYPNSWLSAGVDISVFGYDKYREMMVRLISGKRLSEQWSLGIGVQYSFLQAELLESTRSRLSTDLGITFTPIDKLLIGMLIMNLPSVYMGDKMIDIEYFKSYLIQIGFQWEFINNMLIAGSAGTTDTETVVGNLGIEYTAFDSFRIRAGVQTASFLPSLGVGYSFSMFTIDAAVVYHSVLGMSTGVGLSISF